MAKEPLLDELPAILTKLTEKQRAIWSSTLSAPLSDKTLANDTNLIQDALEVMWHSAASPQAGVSAWLRWTQKVVPHAFSLPSEADSSDTPHKAWLRYLQGFHNLSNEAVTEMVAGLDGLDEQRKNRFLFYFKQWMEAFSPSNNLITNPELLAYTLENLGGNLFKGFDNLLNDISCSNGELSISMTDPHAFEVGKNLATTPGTVVLRNDVMELIQYAPTTKSVYKRPMLLAPPWINKYYILDLTEKMSLVKWLVDQGYTVFLISWINPDGSQTAGSFTDYMKLGILAALDAIEAITGEKKPHAAGYCTGGTLLATTLAWLAAGGEEERVSSATFMATLIDFTEPGDLGIFIDPEQVDALTTETREMGYLDGKKLARTFNMLRPNDLIWSYVVKNYLKGEDPIPFNILYWNSDSANIPGEMYSWYLKNTYLENQLATPCGATLEGRPIDMGSIKTPCYFLATEEDHIVLWKGAYKGARLMGGPVRFVLAESGHVAGVVNPPHKKKYGHRTSGLLPDTPDEWLQTATLREESWWLDWVKWLKPKSGKKVPGRPTEDAPTAFGPAPGTYVKRRLEPKKRCRENCSCQKGAGEFPMVKPGH